ncbi:glycosyl hydrolase family 28-related protein [Azospirillum sp. SYSU D00513]|uniref:glycosyl hydrolase family 28-related protein n=1 Tax=Azospirillum sp. SYSU D00513 TaxID=2812561 RepID=UPI001A9730D0|nr:glycosyl hydrolase family 28-related protein [Azospirillum sp. SYSU D00513]
MPTPIRVPRGNPRAQYLADGAQTVFSFPFPVFTAEDLQVFLGAALQSTGYAVAGAGATAGGTVTFAAAPAAGTAVLLRRRTPIERTTDFSESGPLPASSLNGEFDRLTAGLQQVAGDQELMLRYADTDLPASNLLPGRLNRAGKLLGFDSAGNPTVQPPVDEEALSTYVPPGTGAVSRPVRDKLSDFVSVKDFGAVGDGIVDDTLAIQAAIAAAKAVHVPPGIYRIGNTLTLPYGHTLGGAGQTSILRAASAAFDLVHLPDSYATLRDLRLEGGLAGVRLFGRDGPCVQNALLDLTVWDARYGLLLDGYADPGRPCYWNNVARVLIARPAVHGVWLTRSGAGDTPNANRFHAVRVYSLSAPISGSGFYVEQGKYNNSFVDCETDLSTSAHSCFRVGANSEKTLIVNLYTETLGGVPNVMLEEGSNETAISNLLSASAGPAIQDLSGGRYTASNAGYPDKNRMERSRITTLTVEALRFDTDYIEPAAGGLVELDLRSSVCLLSAYGGPVEARLPGAGSANGHQITIKKTDASANTVTITEAGGPGPDGRSVALGNRYDMVTLVSNGAGWWIVGGTNPPGNSHFHEGAPLFEPDLNQSLYLVSAYGGAVEVRLPVPGAPHAVGRSLTVKKTDPSGNPVTVTKQGGGGPDNEPIPLTGQGHAVTVMSNDAGWHILGRNP